MENFVIVFILLFVLIVVVNLRDGKENYSSNYVKLNNTRRNPPSVLFSSATSRCAGKPYMFSSSPYETAMANNIQQPGCYSGYIKEPACSYSGYNRGRKVNFEYSPLSNGAWDNALCDSCEAPQSLCVL